MGMRRKLFLQISCVAPRKYIKRRPNTLSTQVFYPISLRRSATRTLVESRTFGVSVIIQHFLLNVPSYILLVFLYRCTGRMVVIAEDSVRFAHSGPSQRFLRGLRPLVSVGPLPLPVSAGGHASAITTILPLEIRYKNIAIL